jgi:threonyl-tRNA synthetase
MILFDQENPPAIPRSVAIWPSASKFGERQYRFKSNNRNMMLRFAACFGMFSIMRDMHISKNTLPMKMYELSTYSFRHEQKGEVIGLKRLRAFTMPDMHTLCSDMDEAMQCFEEQLQMGWQSGRDLETTLVGVFRCRSILPPALRQLRNRKAHSLLCIPYPRLPGRR